MQEDNRGICALSWSAIAAVAQTGYTEYTFYLILKFRIVYKL